MHYANSPRFGEHGPSQRAFVASDDATQSVRLGIARNGTDPLDLKPKIQSNMTTNRPNSSKSVFCRACVAIGVAVLFSCLHAAFGQSIGCNFVNTTNSGIHGIDNTEPDSLLPVELAGVPMYAQTNWNNLSSQPSIGTNSLYGGATNGTLTLMDSQGNNHTLNVQWSDWATVNNGTYNVLGTPDGKLFDEGISTWNPGANTALPSSWGLVPGNDQPLVYISGLSSWRTNIPDAECYAVVLYTIGDSYYEPAIGSVESVTGDPAMGDMAEGTNLGPVLYEGDSATFTGTYVPTTGTSSGSETYGANYMFFTGLTNNSILLRLDCTGYGAALDGFQIVPIFPAPPTNGTITISPGSSVVAYTPVTLDISVSGDPLHTNLWYQWQTDNGTGGPATNSILDATNASYTFTPTNASAAYNLQFQAVVTNIFGTYTSAIVTVTVNPGQPPSLTQDTTPGPGNLLSGAYAYLNGDMAFTAAFSGSPTISFQWEANTSGTTNMSDYTNILGATSATLTLTNLQIGSSGLYLATAANDFGSSNSSPAALTVLPDPALPTNPAVAYPYAVFTNNPLAYWRLGETINNSAYSVQAYDYSGNNFNATYGVGAYDDIAGPAPSSFPGFESTNTSAEFFNATVDSWISCPSLNLNTNAVTITAWINPSGAVGGGWGLLMWRAGGDAAGLNFGSSVSNGVAELGYIWNSNSPSTYNFNSGLYAPLGQWSFVALTITPTNSTLYLYYMNGSTPVLSKVVQNIANQPEAFSGGTTYIGSDPNNPSGDTFNGNMDEVAVFNQSLSETQIQNLFLAATGLSGVAPSFVTGINATNVNTFVGQPLNFTAAGAGAPPPAYQWQSGSGGVFTNVLDGPGVSGANSSALSIASASFGSSSQYQVILANASGAITSAVCTVSLTPVPTNGLWTVNFQETNSVGFGQFTGLGALGNGTFWNVVPDVRPIYSGGNYTNISDFTDNGVTHSGIGCIFYNGGGLSGSSTRTGSADVKTILDQWLISYYSPSALTFTGVPNGIYNLALYGCAGGANYNNAGTTFVVHGSNGTFTNSTYNVQDTYLTAGDNTVIITNVAVTGGTLNVDLDANTNVIHGTNMNTSADFNGAQIQLVSYLAPTVAFSATPTNVFVTQAVTFINNSVSATNWIWSFGDGGTNATLSSGDVFHAYTAPGSYTVSLTASGVGGESSVTYTNYIVVLPKPGIGSTALSNGNFVLSGTGGISGAQFQILSSTNLALPLPDWTTVYTGTFASDGSYSYTNSTTARGAQFFILVSP